MPWSTRTSCAGSGTASILEYAGKRGGKPSPVQQDISLRLIELARAGKRVLRLKGGDPFMFGRGGEESQALAKAKIPFRIVPGITAGVGGLAYAGIPSTHRDTNHSVIFLTGHDATGKMPANVNWQAVATASPVIVMYMAVKNLGEIAQTLMEGGRAPKDPVTIISNASLPHQQVQATTLDQAGAFVAQQQSAHPGHRRRRPCLRLARNARLVHSRRSGRTPLAKAFVVAAPSSGSGKTMLTLGLLRAFRNQGLRVASAKVGPDHIDPRFHEAASGRPCLNLDPWAMKREVIASLLTDLNHDADLVIVEGVMGLFDGPQGARGSTADLAQDMGLPIVLVLDCRPSGPIHRRPCRRFP